MENVHVFISTGRFSSFEELRSFIDPQYTEDGDSVPSQFMREVDLSGYEPGCIEAIHSERPLPLAELLAGASYADQWLSQLDGTLTADAAICVFPSNVVGNPQGCSLTYVGSFNYSVVHSDWFQQRLHQGKDPA